MVKSTQMGWNMWQIGIVLSPWYIQCTQNIKNIFNFDILPWKIHLQHVFSQHRNYKVFRIAFQRIQLVKYPTSHFPIKFRSKSDILHTFSLHEPLLRFDDFFWIHKIFCHSFGLDETFISKFGLSTVTFIGVWYLCRIKDLLIER